MRCATFFSELLCNITRNVINFFSSFFKFSTVTSTRGHQYKLYKSHCSHSTRSRFFAERVINVWNCLLPSVDYYIHLQLLGVVLTVLILLRPLNVTLLEFLVIL